jgi:tetratricopeptide (TPR) repeat protein
MRFLLAILASIFLLSGPARGDRSNDARTLFQEANAHFAVGEFAEAAEKFQAAYKLRPDAALLYNAAQAYRLAGNHQKALVLYKNYVQFYPKAPNQEDVRLQITKLQEIVAASESAKTAPPTSTAEHVQPIRSSGGTSPESTRSAPSATASPGTQPEASAQPAPTAATSTEVTATRAEKKTPVYKKWWLWTIVGVVVAGAVVAGAVVATTPSGKWTTTGNIGPGAKSALVSW